MLTIKVFDIIQSPYAVSREQGELMYVQVMNAHNKTTGVIIIDFEGITNTLYAFLNCMYGQFILSYGGCEIIHRIEFVNCTPIIITKLNSVKTNAINNYIDN